MMFAWPYIHLSSCSLLSWLLEVKSLPSRNDQLHATTVDGLLQTSLKPTSRTASQPVSNLTLLILVENFQVGFVQFASAHRFETWQQNNWFAFVSGYVCGCLWFLHGTPKAPAIPMLMFRKRIKHSIYHAALQTHAPQPWLSDSSGHLVCANLEQLYLPGVPGAWVMHTMLRYICAELYGCGSKPCAPGEHPPNEQSSLCWDVDLTILLAGRYWPIAILYHTAPPKTLHTCM